MKTTLDFEAVKNDHIYIVRADLDDNLMQVKSQMDEIKSSIEETRSKMASVVGLEKKNLKLDWSTQHGYCFKVTMTIEKALRLVFLYYKIISHHRSRSTKVKINMLILAEQILWPYLD